MGRRDYSDDGRFVMSLREAIERDPRNKHQIIFK